MNGETLFDAADPSSAAGRTSAQETHFGLVFQSFSTSFPQYTALGKRHPWEPAARKGASGL